MPVIIRKLAKISSALVIHRNVYHVHVACRKKMLDIQSIEYTVWLAYVYWIIVLFWLVINGDLFCTVSTSTASSSFSVYLSSQNKILSFQHYSITIIISFLLRLFRRYTRFSLLTNSFLLFLEVIQHLHLQLALKPEL